MRLRLPPLRERSEDIGELLDLFGRSLASDLRVKPYRFSGEEIARLQTYSWPGNVRELKNLVERTLLLGRPPWENVGGGAPVAVASAIDDTGFPLEWNLDQVEHEHTVRVLDAAGGNKSEAARRLGISRKTLERKLAAWPDSAGDRHT